MNAKVIRLDDCRLTPSPLQIRAAVEAEEEARIAEYYRYVEALRRGMYWVGEER